MRHGAQQQARHPACPLVQGFQRRRAGRFTVPRWMLEKVIRQPATIGLDGVEGRGCRSRCDEGPWNQALVIFGRSGREMSTPPALAGRRASGMKMSVPPPMVVVYAAAASASSAVANHRQTPALCSGLVNRGVSHPTAAPPAAAA